MNVLRITAASSVVVLALVLAGCSSTSSSPSSSGGSSSAPKGANSTSIKDWADPRPAAWETKYPLFAPVSTGDGSLASAQKNGITVCAQTDIKPIESIDPTNGKVIGFEPDILNAAAKILDIPSVKFVNTQFDSFIPALQAGKCTIVMGGIAVRSDRAAAAGIKYTTPYFVYADVIIVQKDGGITNQKDLAGKTIAVVSGSTEAVEAQQLAQHLGGATVRQFPNAAGTYQALLSGAAQAVIDLPVTLSENPQRAKMTTLPGLVPFTPSGQFADEYQKNPYTWGAGAAITKSSAGDLNRGLSVAFQELISDGTMKKTLTKWDVYAPGVFDLVRK